MKLISFSVFATIPMILNLHAEGAVSWHYFAQGKCSAANQEQRLNINKLVLETGKNGCSYVVNDLKKGILSIDCPSHDEADVLGIYNLTTSKGACQKNNRILKLLQDRWLALIPQSKTCVDARNVGGANMSPGNVISQFPKCKEHLIGTDVLEMDCRQVPELNTTLYYANSSAGCQYLQQQLTNPQ